MNKASVIFIAILIAMSSKGQKANSEIGQKCKVSKVTVADVPKRSLDSLVRKEWSEKTNAFLDSGKEEYTYDSYGNLTSQATYYWSTSSNQWYGSDRKGYTFDANGKILLTVDYAWDSSDRKWITNSKCEYAYDSNNNKIRETCSDSDWVAKQWVVTSKTEYTFDNNCNTEEIRYNWDSNSASWLAVHKVENSFDENGNKTSSIWSRLNLETRQWNSYQKKEFISTAQKTTEIESVFESDKWKLRLKTECDYDQAGNLILCAKFSWSGSLPGEWKITAKDEYIYNADNRLISTTNYHAGSVVGEFGSVNKTENSYDANGNMVSGIFSFWSSFDNSWEAEDKTEISYDNSCLVKDVSMIKVPEVISCVSIPTVINSYRSGGSVWDLNERTFLYYSPTDLQNGNKPALTDAVSVYPNPASEYITLNNDKADDACEFRLLDLQGKVVLSQPVRGHARLSVGHLPRGLYVYKISGKAKTITGKVVLK